MDEQGNKRNCGNSNDSREVTPIKTKLYHFGPPLAGPSPARCSGDAAE
jgi:hypothetical protein